MKKSREVSLSEILNNIDIGETLDVRIMNDLPVGKPFSVKVLCDYYKVSKNIIYPIVNRLVDDGTLKKYKGKFENRNNIFLYERIR